MKTLCTAQECIETGCSFPDCLDKESREIYDNCPGCQREGMYPSHNGSVMCESGSIASGGTKSHCTCDMCF
ncbi:hypothetical protein KAR91_46485 [Candidatus Pacearchaeota archaeon]|nr:hypothetical protein [Candidatus Pacearchaeota archaeon]